MSCRLRAFLLCLAMTAASTGAAGQVQIQPQTPRTLPPPPPSATNPAPQPAPAPSVPAASATPAPGGAAAGGLGNEKDKDKPVEISADNLEVQRDKQVAIFRGNVEVTQGSTRMRADSMVVYYREGSQRTAAQQQAQRSGEDIRAGKVARIDAFGKVFMSSEGETAQADKATYDLDRRILQAEGNVILTRNSDVLTCAKLNANLETKQNVCTGGPGGRVKSIFNSSEKNNKAGATN